MAVTSALAVFKALGDESRLAILRILLTEDSYVELLASRLGLTSATVSFHLKKLESAGLVTCSRTQFYRIYSANREVFGATLASLVGTVPQPDDDTRYREEVLAAFFENGKLSKMPSQRKKREIVLRHLLRFLDPDREYGEKELDALLEEISVPDYCFVRREMIAFGMLARRKNPDGGADLYRVMDNQGKETHEQNINR